MVAATGMAAQEIKNLATTPSLVASTTPEPPLVVLDALTCEDSGTVKGCCARASPQASEPLWEEVTRPIRISVAKTHAALLRQAARR